jgi:hypothetical protein
MDAAGAAISIRIEQRPDRRRRRLGIGDDRRNLRHAGRHGCALASRRNLGLNRSSQSYEDAAMVIRPGKGEPEPLEQRLLLGLDR